MATKKSMWVVIGFFIISALLLGFVIEAQAETMKCRIARVLIKEERMLVSDEEGHMFAMRINEGVAFFENGDITNYKSQSIDDRSTGPGKGSQMIVYSFFTFEDGSSIIARSEYRSIADSSGKISTKATGEIIKGTGRFVGIKGTFSATGKMLPPIKGETEKYYADATLTYTLPPK